MSSNISRREFLPVVAIGAGLGARPDRSGPRGPRASSGAAERTSGPIDIGSRRELFVDDFLIERLDGARRVLHHPVPQDVAIEHDAPWEGTGCGYHSIFQDGSIYRMYYKAWHLEIRDGRLYTGAHPLYCCYAESDDGINWRKPKLGLFEFRGSKDNNIVMVSGRIGKVSADPGHPAVFKDENPACAPDARYKAIVRCSSPHGLLAFKSPDGLHWSLMVDRPVITAGAFDSQNLAFWDPVRREYRAYWRIFTSGITTKDKWQPQGYRAIRTATSRDFVNWGPHTDLTYKNSPPEHLYTNQIKPYYRAPHIFIGFPTRYIDRGWSDSMHKLPEPERRALRAKANRRYGTALTEGLIMASRDGVLFERWNEAFLRPGIQRPGTWHYGQQYIAWHVVETRSNLPGAPNELSLYATERYWMGPGSVLRRYSLRIDGFVSVQGPMSGGELTTKPLIYSGSRLCLNFSTSAAGGIRVEVQDPEGNPIRGLSLEDCNVVFGDELERVVTWKSGADLARLAGQPVRLRFELRDADLYSFRFTG